MEKEIIRREKQMAVKDISRLLQQRVLETLTDAEKWEINERQIKEILSMNPGYAPEYFTRSFSAKQHIKQPEPVKRKA